MLKTIDGMMLARMLLSASAALEIRAQEINELNVFPVPDGDTGLNMSLTMRAASEALRGVLPGQPAGKVAETAARLYLRGARGNSGVILSLLFRGFARHTRNCEQIDAETFTAALMVGVEAAYGAIMKPTEGTILTVSRVSAEAAITSAQAGSGIEQTFAVLRLSAETALTETQRQNPVLTKAGVVDAGGFGLCVMYEGMEAALLGREIQAAPVSVGKASARASFSAFSGEEIEHRYCTECVIARENALDALPFRAYLDSVGDSLVFVEDDEVIKIHVHCDAPHEVLARALQYGALSTAKVEDMRLQHSQMLDVESLSLSVNPLPLSPPDLKVEKPYGFVAVSSGAGLAAVLTDLGVDQIVEGGQTMNPSTEDLLSALERTLAKTVFVLPGNKNVILAAEQCVPLSRREVVVVPTQSIPQTVAALLAFDAALPPTVNADAMKEAFGQVHTGQVTYAVRDSVFDGRDIRAGDYMALHDGTLLYNSPDCEDVLRHLAKSLSGGSRFLTLFYGMDISEEESRRAAAIFRTVSPEAEVDAVYGGQAVYYYIISAEP